MKFSDIYGPATKSDGKRMRAAITALGDIPERGESVHLTSDGDFSFEHVLAAVVDETGTSSVRIMCWAMAVKTARNIMMAKSGGAISSVRCVMDPRVWRLAQREGASIMKDGGDGFGTHRNHIKAMIITVDETGDEFVILSSANPNHNSRIETYSIIADAGVADFFRGVFDEMLSGGDPFAAGEFRKRGAK